MLHMSGESAALIHKLTMHLKLKLHLSDEGTALVMQLMTHVNGENSA